MALDPQKVAFWGWTEDGDGLAQAVALWGWEAGAAETHVSKLRIRALDPLLKSSAWVVSSAFTVVENAAPTIAYVSPVADELLSGNTPYLYFDVDDADGDGEHVEFYLSLRPDFGSGFHIDSSLSQENWEEAASPYTTWTALGSGGATAGNRVRYHCTPLRYDVYFLKARAYDGILYSDYLSTIAFRVTPDGAQTLTCTIGENSYSIMGLQVTENTGGEASPFSFRITLADYLAAPIVKGASVSIGFTHPKEPDYPRVWNGTVEQKPQVGAEVTINCVQDDAYLSRLLVTGDLASDDIGANLAALITTYGGPLTGTNIDTTLGVDAPITGNLQTLLSFFQKWANLLGLLLWVDSDGDVHLVDPASLADPQFILYEGYE